MDELMAAVLARFQYYQAELVDTDLCLPSNATCTGMAQALVERMDREILSCMVGYHCDRVRRYGDG